MKNTMTKGEIRHELAKAKKELKDAWICGEGYEYDQNFIVCYKDGTVLETREANERLPQIGIIGIQFFGTDAHYTVGYEMYNGEKVLIEDESEDACYRVEYLPLTSTESTTENQTEVITMMYITSKVTGEKKATITMATEKRLQELMNREHQSNEAKFLAWALEEYKCECGCGGASIKEIRKYVEQEDWLRDEFCFDTEGYMEDTARAMNNRFHDYMAYWCRLCYSSLSIKSFNKLVKAVYDMTDEYGYVIYPEEVEEEPEAAETVEKIKEGTTMAKRFYFTNENGDNIGNDHIGNIRGAKAAAKRLANEFNCEVCINDCETEDMLDFVYPDRKPETETVEETAEQETELNTEVEAEQTAEPETFSYEFNEIHKITISKRNNVYVEEFFEKMGGSYVKLGEEAWGCIEDIEEYYGIKINRNVQTDTEESEYESESESESEPTVDSNTVETYQGNINVLIVADIANTFEMITHTGYFDTS